MDKEKIIQWISGDGSGSGSGSGDGSGSGYGYKLKEHEGNDVYYIDSVPTVIRSTKGNYARGYIINQDFSTEKCYIARSPDGKLFAHGKNLHDAVNSLNQKIAMCMTEEERISLFCKTFEKDKKYKGKIFFDWHSRLTGSCYFGRTQFVKDRNLDLEKEYSVDEFISIVENAYGSEIIKKVKKEWQK